MQGRTFRTSSRRLSRDEAGFTLVEVMVASGLTGVVMLALAVATDNFGQSALSFRRGVPASVEREQFQDFFSKLVGASWVSTEYLHEPVSISTAGGNPCVASGACAAAGPCEPCVRRQGYSEAGVFAGGQTTFQEVTSVIYPTANKYIEFFRDDDATLSTATPAYSDDVDALNAPRSFIERTFPMTLATNYLQSDYFATWRLDSTASAPFFMLSQYPSRNAFVFKQDLAAARTFQFLPTDPGMVGVPNASARNSLAGAIQSGLLLVYNSADPKQYTIMSITTATAEAAGTYFDFVLNPVNLSGAISGTPAAWYRAAGSYSPTLNNQTYTWGGGNMFWATTQAGSFYLFPTQFFSMSDNQTAAGVWTPAIGFQPFAENPANSGIDFGHICDTSNGLYPLQCAGATSFYGHNSPGPAPAAGGPLTPVPQLIGIPLVATAFFLGAGVLPPGCPIPPVAIPPIGCPADANYFSLQSISLPGPITRTHISMLTPTLSLAPNTAPVYFARKLGTSKVEVFLK